MKNNYQEKVTQYQSSFPEDVTGNPLLKKVKEYDRSPIESLGDDVSGKRGFLLLSLFPKSTARKAGYNPAERRGFTLIELLVVVLIIGILSAVALPQYQTAVDKARYTQHLTLARNIKDAQERYYLANGSYADSYDVLDIELPAGGTMRKITDGSRMEYPDGFFYDMYTFYVVGGKTELARVVYGYDKGGQGVYKAGSRTCYGYNERQIRLCKALGGTLLQADSDVSVFNLP